MRGGVIGKSGKEKHCSWCGHLQVSLNVVRPSENGLISVIQCQQALRNEWVDWQLSAEEMMQLVSRQASFTGRHQALGHGLISFSGRHEALRNGLTSFTGRHHALRHGLIGFSGHREALRNGLMSFTGRHQALRDGRYIFQAIVMLWETD